jgi:hypothetical protein
MKLSAILIAGCLVVGTAPAALSQALVKTSPPPAGATKICAPYVPNVWRTVTPVPGTWALDDCRNMGQTVGASTLQVACFFEKEQPGQVAKFDFGGASPIANPPSVGNVPNPNCGWGS